MMDLTNSVVAVGMTR